MNLQVLGILLLQLPQSWALWCYQCFSADTENDCTRRPHTLSDICQDAFCLKTAIYFPNGSLMSLSRTCTSIDMPSYCSTGQMQMDQSVYDPSPPASGVIDSRKKERLKLCTYFCHHNYCNSAPSLFAVVGSKTAPFLLNLFFALAVFSFRQLFL